MNEVINDTDIRSKRRLPPWMQSNDASKTENLGNLDELCSISGNQTETQGAAAVSMIESLSSEADLVLSEKKKNLNDIEIFAKKYSKKNARKLSKREVSNNSLKVLSEGMTEDEAELTVEDLISIAEEFLASEKEIQNEHSDAQKSESESDFIPLSSSESSIPRRRKLNGEIRLSKCTQKQPEESVPLPANKIIRSGDVAQDMLELFLGPLLKKAPLKDPDPEITTCDSDSLVGSVLDVEEQAPLMKKKSSLRDQVAMFFD